MKRGIEQKNCIKQLLEEFVGSLLSNTAFFFFSFSGDVMCYLCAGIKEWFSLLEGQFEFVSTVESSVLGWKLVEPFQGGEERKVFTDILVF